MNTYISERQIGEAEAFFKILPDFKLKDSNVTTVLVPVNKKENRSKFLKIDKDAVYNGAEKIEIEGRDGFYVEKYDIVSKYERIKFKHEKDSEMSFSHFAKMYSPVWKIKKRYNSESESDNPDSEDEGTYDMEEEEEQADKMKVIETNKNTGNPTEDSKFDFIMKCQKPGSGSEHQKCKLGNPNRLPTYL